MTFASQVMFSGGLAVVHVDRAALTRQLPPSVRLPAGPDSTFPCLLALGRQTEGTTFFGGWPIPAGVEYNELMVAVPFAQWDAAPLEPHFFMLGMTCDFAVAQWIGNTYYGFRKRLARIEYQTDHFLLHADDGQVAFIGVLAASNRQADGAIGWMLAATRQTVLGCRDDGSFVRSRFEWDFREAVIEPANLTLESAPLPELGGECRVDEATVYRVRRMRWALSWPEPVAVR